MAVTKSLPGKNGIDEDGVMRPMQIMKQGPFSNELPPKFVY